MQLSQKDLWTIRAIMQKCGWGEFMYHISGFMAEQADKVARDSEQEQALIGCSELLTKINEFFTVCGHFDYTKDSLSLEPEYLEIIKRYNNGK
jgi:hypothetical protein